MLAFWRILITRSGLAWGRKGHLTIRTAYAGDCKWPRRQGGQGTSPGQNDPNSWTLWLIKVGFPLLCANISHLELFSYHYQKWILSLGYTFISCGCHNMRAKSLQLCLTHCHPMNHSSPGFSVHGILQAGVLEWVAMSFSRGSSWFRDGTCISYVSCIGRQVLYS